MSCLNCKKEHSTSKCPCLYEELENGFYVGSGGQPPDEDENGFKKFKLGGSSHKYNISWNPTAVLPSSPILSAKRWRKRRAWQR